MFLLCPAGKPTGYDRVRNAEIGNKDFELDVLEEAYTTEHWLVRIYKVKDLENRGVWASVNPQNWFFLMFNAKSYLGKIPNVLAKDNNDHCVGEPNNTNKWNKSSPSLFLRCDVMSQVW